MFVEKVGFIFALLAKINGYASARIGCVGYPVAKSKSRNRDAVLQRLVFSDKGHDLYSMVKRASTDRHLHLLISRN